MPHKYKAINSSVKPYSIVSHLDGSALKDKYLPEVVITSCLCNIWPPNSVYKLANKNLFITYFGIRHLLWRL